MIDVNVCTDIKQAERTETFHPGTNCLSFSSEDWLEPEEIDLIRKMRKKGETLTEISMKAGLPVEIAENILESLLGKGFVWASHKSGQLRYRVAPYVDEKDVNEDLMMAFLMEYCLFIE
jgi:hypothetical protein